MPTPTDSSLEHKAAAAIDPAKHEATPQGWPFGELSDDQIMATVGRMGELSNSLKLGHQWGGICNLVRQIIRERYTPSASPSPPPEALAKALEGIAMPANKLMDCLAVPVGDAVAVAGQFVAASPAPVPAVQQWWKLVAWTVAGEVTNWSRDFSMYRTQHYVRPVYAASPASAQDVADFDPIAEIARLVAANDALRASPDRVMTMKPSNAKAYATLQQAAPARLLQKLDASIAWLERGELLPGTSACIGLDDIKVIRATLAAATPDGASTACDSSDTKSRQPSPAP